jgi:hypothetical protein
LISLGGLAQGIPEQPDWANWYFKEVGTEPNYSSLLEALASSQEERRSILHSYIEPSAQDREEGRRLPTAAHRAIADLVASGFVRVIVTTNFDRLLENALRERGVEATIVSSVDALAGAEPIAHSTCYLLKLHGDYKDARILNTDQELANYPPQYESLLDRIFDEYGLIVCGWSGEWDHALRSAFLRAPNRRYPVYWTARGNLAAASAQKLVDHRRARVIPIESADEFFVRLRERVETLLQSGQQNPASITLLINAVKRYLAKPECRIQLHDLFEQETKTLLQRLDSDEFSPNAPWSIDTLRSRRDRYEAMTESIARMAGVVGRWGDGNELAYMLDILRGLHRHAQKQNAGLTHYIHMRLYPAVLVFVAYGLGLARAERWQALHQLFSANIDIEYRAESVRALEVFFPHCWSGGERDIWNQFEKQNLRTPFSDHLHRLFAEWASSFATLTPDFELLFERFEMLGALAYLDSSTKENIQQTLVNRQEFLWTPLGRSLWHERNRVRILAEILKEPVKSQLVGAGFAGGNGELLNLYVESYNRMCSRVRWM